MVFLGYPIEIWLAAIVAVFIRLQSSSALTWLGATTTVVVSLFTGVVLYRPAIELLGISAIWEVPVAIIIALSSENIMKSIVELSADREWFKDWIKYLVSKGDSRK